LRIELKNRINKSNSDIKKPLCEAVFLCLINVKGYAINSKLAGKSKEHGELIVIFSQP
tara:strand:+ start:799 stop:972 length:174 start_codon:yes stop_codon:yes gene_type:complete